jgi:hypothetical protein
LMARVNPACTADLSRSTPSAKRLSLGKSTLLNLGEPSIQALSFALPHHRQKVLNELVRSLQRRSGLTKSSQMFLFDLFQFVWMTHEQRDRRSRRVMRQAGILRRSFYLMGFESFQESIDHPL